MTALISYGIGYTVNSGAATSLVIQPPPIYAAGNLLVMGVIAGNVSGGVAPAVPSGWTQVSTTGSPLALFTKTATGSESAYTVTLGSSSNAGGFVAAYPAASVASSSFGNTTSAVSYTATFPTGVTSGQTVLMLGGAVCDADSNGGDSGWPGNAGMQNFNLPASWATDVPVFGPADGDYSLTTLPVAIGLAEVTGSTANPTLTSPQECDFYAGFLVLTITGTPPSPYLVTATSPGNTAAVGIALTVKMLTGAASVAQIVAGAATESYYAGGGTAVAPGMPITPAATGSVVYGALTQSYGVTGGNTYTARSGTTFSQNVPDAVSDAIYGTFRSTSTTTANSALTLGGTAPTNAYTNGVAAEILKAPGQTITETATATVSAIQPGQYPTATAAQTAVFTGNPAPGTLLVAMASANTAWWNGYATITISDTLGLTWTLLTSNVNPGYAGVLVAQVPVPPPFAYLTPPGRSSPMAWQRTARPTFAPQEFSDTDTGAGTETQGLTATIPGADTGTGTEGQSASPGAYAPENFAGSDTQVLEVVSGDTAAGADAGSIPALGDAGAGTEAATVEPVGTETGTGTESTAATSVITSDSAAGTDDTGAITVRPLITVRWSAADKLSKAGGTMP